MRIEDLLYLQDAISLRFTFKALTHELLLLSNFSRKTVLIMFCPQLIPCLTPLKILEVIIFHTIGPD